MNWIFQGNPTLFDIDAYLHDFDNVNWTVRQKRYAQEMKHGDRVFFWRSSGNGKLVPGIVAVGTLTEEPKVYPEDTEALKYWKDASGDTAELRVRIRVTHRLPLWDVFPKQAMAGISELSGLAILTSPRQTNYKIPEITGNSLYEHFLAALAGMDTGSQTHYSWTIEGRDSVYKILDKSAYISWGSGIPIPVRPFFISGEMSPGEKRQVSLVYQGKAYTAHIDMERPSSARTRLFWNSEFSALLKETFPHHFQLYNNDKIPEGQVILRLKRLSGYESYEVSFAGDVPDKVLEQDIQAEEYEDREPQMEGSVREYFGRRYERSALNRKQAIRYHGLFCNACGFNFEKVYGARGADYIEVHHLKPIHTYEKEQHVDPKTDLITLCSNCHRMVHRDQIHVLTFDELRELVSCLP